MTIFFVILVTHPKSYRDDRSPRFRRKTVEVEVRTGTIVKNSGILRRGRSQMQKAAFSRFMVPFDYPAHSLQETVLPKPIPMESRDSEGVPFASLESL